MIRHYMVSFFVKYIERTGETEKVKKIYNNSHLTQEEFDQIDNECDIDLTI